MLILYGRHLFDTVFPPLFYIISLSIVMSTDEYIHAVFFLLGSQTGNAEEIAKMIYATVKTSITVSIDVLCSRVLST